MINPFITECTILPFQQYYPYIFILVLLSLPIGYFSASIWWNYNYKRLGYDQLWRNCGLVYCSNCPHAYYHKDRSYIIQINE